MGQKLGRNRAEYDRIVACLADGHGPVARQRLRPVDPASPQEAPQSRAPQHQLCRAAHRGQAVYPWPRWSVSPSFLQSVSILSYGRIIFLFCSIILKYIVRLCYVTVHRTVTSVMLSYNVYRTSLMF